MLGFYKPSEKGNGAAFQFNVQLSKKKDSFVLMVSGCPQKGPKPAPGSTDSPFNWKEDKVIMKLSTIECGEIAAYIAGMPCSKKVADNGVNLIHNYEGKITNLKLKRPKSDDQYGNWGLSIKRDDKSAQTFISSGEALQVRVYCENAIYEGAFLDKRQNQTLEY